MKKLSKLSSINEIRVEIHCFLVEKTEGFTLQSAYREIIKLCEDGIDTNLIKELFMERVDALLEDGLIRPIGNNFYSTEEYVYQMK